MFRIDRLSTSIRVKIKFDWVFYFLSRHKFHQDKPGMAIDFWKSKALRYFPIVCDR